MEVSITTLHCLKFIECATLDNALNFCEALQQIILHDRQKKV